MGAGAFAEVKGAGNNKMNIKFEPPFHDGGTVVRMEYD